MMPTVRTIDRPTIKKVTNSGSSITFRWFPRQGKEIKEARGCFSLAEVFVGLRANRKRETTPDEWAQLMACDVASREASGLYGGALHLGGLTVSPDAVAEQFTSDEANRFEQVKSALGRGLVFAHGLQSTPIDFRFAVLHPAILAHCVTGADSGELPATYESTSVWAAFAADLWAANTNNQTNMAEAA